MGVEQQSRNSITHWYVSEQLRHEEWGAAVAVLTPTQARLVFRHMKGTAVAKPWETGHRGEIMVYVPEKAGNAKIDFPPYPFEERALGKGLVGIALIRKIVELNEPNMWVDTFEHHREKGGMPYNPTYLWFMEAVRQFIRPIKVRLGGEWLEEDELIEGAMDGEVLPPDHLLKEYVMPKKRRILHRIPLDAVLSGL